MSITDGKETDMRRLVNPGMEKALRRAQGDVGPIQALLQGLWRGDCLLAAYAAEDKYLRIRMQGRECLPVFTSYEAAEAFQQMLLMRNGPALAMHEESIEALLAAGCALAVDAGQETGAVLEESVLSSVMETTKRLTGGRTPGEDLPLMRLHMETVGNGERAVRSHMCGCFHCGETFEPTEIARFALEADGRRTAHCPRCGIDAVLTQLDSLPLTGELIGTMKKRFFSGADSEDDGVLRLLYMQCVRERLEKTGKC